MVCRCQHHKLPNFIATNWWHFGVIVWWPIKCRGADTLASKADSSDSVRAANVEYLFEAIWGNDLAAVLIFLVLFFELIYWRDMHHAVGQHSCASARSW